MAQWSPAFILILPVAFAALVAWRPGPLRLVLAVLIALMLDLTTAFAFWLQGEWRSTGDTIRLVAFVAVPAALVTATTAFAIVRVMSGSRP